MVIVKLANGKYLAVGMYDGKFYEDSRENAMVFGNVYQAESFAKENGYEKFEIEIF